MIKIFVTLGVVGGLVVAYLTVFAVGPISQVPPPKSLLTEFRVEGLVPTEVNLKENPIIEDSGVFEVPKTDAASLKAAMKAAASMNMGAGGTMDMSGSNGASTMAATDSTGKKMDMSKSSGDKTAMAKGSAPMDMGEGGLLVSEDGGFDREISLTMSEWKFSDMNIEVKTGERIKFTIKNGGQIPHEFMFMSAPLMQAVKYRATRADWNLVEHKALFEQALVLPGGDFTFVLKVTKPGSWMFMCMLPYHMQMGMMGQMSTKGMAMKM